MKLAELSEIIGKDIINIPNNGRFLCSIMTAAVIENNNTVVAIGNGRTRRQARSNFVKFIRNKTLRYSTAFGISDIKIPKTLTAY